MAQSMGHATKVGAGDASPVTEIYEFLRCTMGKRTAMETTPGIRGTRSRIKDQAFVANSICTGQLEMVVRSDALAAWLPRILGTAGALTETIAEFYLHVHKVAAGYLYDGVKVARATFRSSKGQPLILLLDLVGKTESVSAFPGALASYSTKAPLLHYDSTLTLGGAATKVDNIEAAIDNLFLQDEFFNSLTPQEFPESDRLVTLTCDVPFTASELGLYAPDIAGIAGSLAYANGSDTLDFSFANLKAPATPPEIGGRNQRLSQRLTYSAFQDGATKELVVTNTPG